MLTIPWTVRPPSSVTPQVRVVVTVPELDVFTFTRNRKLYCSRELCIPCHYNIITPADISHQMRWKWFCGSSIPWYNDDALSCWAHPMRMEFNELYFWFCCLAASSLNQCSFYWFSLIFVRVFVYFHLTITTKVDRMPSLDQSRPCC